MNPDEMAVAHRVTASSLRATSDCLLAAAGALTLLAKVCWLTLHRHPRWRQLTAAATGVLAAALAGGMVTDRLAEAALPPHDPVDPLPQALFLTWCAIMLALAWFALEYCLDPERPGGGPRGSR